jgi:hypothetical protein
MVTAIILAICLGFSFIASKSVMFGIKIVAAFAWFALAIQWINNPILTAGSATHEAVLYVLYAIAAMFLVAELGYEYTKDSKTGIVSRRFRFGRDKDKKEVVRRDWRTEAETYRNRVSMATNGARQTKRR